MGETPKKEKGEPLLCTKTSLQTFPHKLFQAASPNIKGAEWLKRAIRGESTVVIAILSFTLAEQPFEVSQVNLMETTTS